MSAALLLAFFNGFSRGLAPAPRVVRRPRNVLARPALPPAVDLEDQEQALSVPAPVAHQLVRWPVYVAPRAEVFIPPQSAAAPAVSLSVPSQPATSPAALTAPRSPDVGTPGKTWKGTCGARCAHTGRACALPAGHLPAEVHAIGRTRFTAVAQPGATRFRGAEALAAAAQHRPVGVFHG